MRDKKARIGQSAAGRLMLVTKKTEIVRSITAIHHEKTGAPRYLIQESCYAVAPDGHYIIGRPAPANQLWILSGQGD
jgi:phenylpyruvate tautomerase PptA (4-oxalocrotonate tautomerase family)